MQKQCVQCKKQIEVWNEKCSGCGYHLVLEPDETRRARYLRRPSLGALLFTQGFAFGARLYVWFLISLIPVVGLVALFVCLFFGRRWSYARGGWNDWEQFVSRMRILDVLGVVWLLILAGVYLSARYL